MNELNIDDRIKICEQCPIYSKDGRCDSRYWINPETNQISICQKPGFVRGCNCFIKVKARNPVNHCVANKW